MSRARRGFGRSPRRGGILSLALGVVALLALTASPAWGGYIHPTVTAEYGKEGPQSTRLGNGCKIAYDDTLDRLYLHSDQKIYGLERTAPGTVTPLGGAFPIDASAIGTGGFSSFCSSYNDLHVDSTNGRIYPMAGEQPGFPPVGNVLHAFESSGAAAAAPWPVNIGGKTCGAATTSTGEVWAGNYEGSVVTKLTSAGAAAGSFALGYQSCRIAVDPQNNDLYVLKFSPGDLTKYTAASGYTTTLSFGNVGFGASMIRVSPTVDRVYVAAPGSSQPVRAFDTNTGTLVEEIPIAPINGFALEESTDTLFLTKWGCCDGGPSGAIIELPGIIVPDATTGDPIGNSEVSGTVNDAGGGPVTECYFEFGKTTAYGSTEPCTPSPPFSENPQAVTAELPGLEGSTVYHYRLVAHNAAGKNVGADKTIEPINVESLVTEPATNIDRTTARLNGSFEGNGEAIDYYFEYEPVTAGDESVFDEKTSEESAGAPTGPTSVHADLTGLTAGTTYRFRVVAESPKGIERGQTLQFATSPAVKNLTTGAATDIDVDRATLHGSLDPDGLATTYYFEWGKTSKYGQATPLPPGDSLSDTSPGDQSVSTLVTNLEPSTTYHYRIVAINSFGKTVGADEIFTTPQPPSIIAFSATNVTATTADLTATINPNGFETSYHFEYGTTKSYGLKAPVPAGVLAAGTSAENVVVAIGGLEETTYHFRLVASNEWGTVTSEDQTFDFKAPTGCPNHVLRQQTGAAYLPDCRAYEIASAAQAGGAAILPEGPSSPYANGKLAYSGFITGIPGSGEPQNVDLNTKDLYVATRKTNGWVTRYVGVPGSEGLASSSAPGGEYGGHLVLSGTGLEYPDAVITDKTLSHLLIWDRRHRTFLNQLPPPPEGTNAPNIYDNEGKLLGKLPTNVAEVPGADVDLVEEGWIGSARINPDYTHYFFSSIRTAFTSEGLTQAPGSVYDNDLRTGALKVISKTEAGDDIPADPTSGYSGEFLRIPAASDDGSHVLISAAAPPFIFFQPPPPFNNHLYMAVRQEDGTHEHHDISVDKNGQNVGVHFESMTSDGSRVYFTTEKQMTPDDTDTSIDLYYWDESSDSLTRASDSGNLPGNSDSCTASWTVYQPWSQMGGGFTTPKCNIQVVPPGQVPVNSFGETKTAKRFDSAMARDSGDIYFYSPEQLDGARGTAESRNLYVYRDGRPQFVATLNPSQPAVRMNVSPDGGHMAMITKSRLTAYDNEGHAQMYLYDPLARSIKCVSCLPSGEPPSDDVRGSMNGAFMTFDGRAFWSTEDSLVPADANDGIDVYEYVDGRPQLISTGTGGNNGNASQIVGLVSVSGDGVDVIFSTFETLVPQDDNGEVYKFYDARTNGGIPVTVEKPPCAAADECHGEDSSAPPLPEIGTGAHLGTVGNYPAKKKKARRCKGKARKCRSARSRRCKKAAPRKGKCRSRKAARRSGQAAKRRSRHG